MPTVTTPRPKQPSFKAHLADCHREYMTLCTGLLHFDEWIRSNGFGKTDTQTFKWTDGRAKIIIPLP